MGTQTTVALPNPVDATSPTLIREVTMMTRNIPLLCAIAAGGLTLGCADPSPTAVQGTASSVSAGVGAGKPSQTGQPPQTGAIRAESRDNVCGVDVLASLFIAGTSFPNPLPGGPPERSTGTLRITWTNPVNGKSLQLHASGHTTRDVTSVSEGGSFSVLETFVGLRAQLKVPNGPVRSFSAGRVVVEIRVTPLPEGGVDVQLLGVRFLAGPDVPESLAGSPEQCAIVIDALT